MADLSCNICIWGPLLPAWQLRSLGALGLPAYQELLRGSHLAPLLTMQTQPCQSCFPNFKHLGGAALSTATRSD